MLLKRLAELATKLDKAGLKGSADVIDILIKRAVDEWKYYGDNSPEDYEDRVKRTREHKGIPEEVSPVVEQVEPQSETETGGLSLDNLKTVIDLIPGHIALSNFKGATKFILDQERGVTGVTLVFGDEEGGTGFVRDVSKLPGFNIATARDDGAPTSAYTVVHSEDTLEIWVECEREVPRWVKLRAYSGNQWAKDLPRVFEYLKEQLR